jgi:hypothetical protein
MHNKVRGSDSAATAPRWLQFGHAIAISAMIQPSEEESLRRDFYWQRRGEATRGTVPYSH